MKSGIQAHIQTWRILHPHTAMILKFPNKCMSTRNSDYMKYLRYLGCIMRERDSVF